ncbi:MAG: hypothetical protein HYS98_01955 [Deltaproteobacteria bacterium]|nr:hypothetical protein [Deltaproteobacteria bacterium]
MLSTLLKTVLKETDSHCLLLINAEGELFETCGELPMSNSKNFCVLAANAVAAQKNMSALLDHKPDNDSLFFSFQGNHPIYFYQLNDRFILLILCSSTTYSGLVRFKCDVYKNHILKLIPELENQDLSPYRQEFMFEEIKDEEIDRLFDF